MKAPHLMTRDERAWKVLQGIATADHHAKMCLVFPDQYEPSARDPETWKRESARLNEVLRKIEDH